MLKRYRLFASGALVLLGQPPRMEVVSPRRCSKSTPIQPHRMAGESNDSLSWRNVSAEKFAVHIALKTPYLSIKEMNEFDLPDFAVLIGRNGVGKNVVIRKKEDRVLTGRQPWELRSCELVFASVEVLHSVAAGPPTQ